MSDASLEFYMDAVNFWGINTIKKQNRNFLGVLFLYPNGYKKEIANKKRSNKKQK